MPENRKLYELFNLEDWNYLKKIFPLETQKKDIENPLLSTDAILSKSNLYRLKELITSKEKKNEILNNANNKFKKYIEKMHYYYTEHPSAQYQHKNKLYNAFKDTKEWMSCKELCKAYNNGKPLFDDNTLAKDWETIKENVINPLIDQINDLELKVLPRLRTIKPIIESKIKEME